MANPGQLAILRDGAAIWNEWRQDNPHKRVDLYGADLHGANLHRANLEAAYLMEADLFGANLSYCNLRKAHLSNARIVHADLSHAKLYRATAIRTSFGHSNLHKANLSEAHLFGADFYVANLTGVNFRGSDLSNAVLVKVDLSDAKITDCRIHGASVWDAKLDRSKQYNLTITPSYSKRITVDNLKVAQFIYLLIENSEIREVIDTITSKVVLILGRFKPKRKAVLDSLRKELRRRNYLPVMFDFDGPSSRNFTETISILAHMARFVIADITSPRSIPQELQAIVPSLAVPIQPLIHTSENPYGMFPDMWKYPWVLQPYRYNDHKQLLMSIKQEIIDPAEEMAEKIQDQRRKLEQRMTTTREG